MNIFAFVVFNNILPIFIIVYLGYFLASKFKLDIFTLSKVYIFIFVPVLIFVKVYETEINLEVLTAIFFGVIMLVLLAGTGWIVSKIMNHKMSMSTALSNSIMFYNSGNFGLPLVMLVFSDTPYASYAVSIQIMILVVQNLSTYSIGFFNAARGQMHYLDTVKKVMSMPALYAIILAIFFKYINIDLREYFFWPSIEYIRDGLIPVALLQVIRWASPGLSPDKYNGYRRSDGTQVLFISSSVPSAVNTALIAVEFNNEPDFASQVVMTSTILSAFTLTAVIYLSQFLFNV
ncbi:MAG: AEC family transporter [Halanaerobiales bacterium]